MGKNKRRRRDLDNDVPNKKIKLEYDQEDGCTTRGCEDTDIKSKRKKKHKHKRQQIKDNIQTIETSADFEGSSDKLSKKKKHKFHHHVRLDHHKTHKKKHKMRELHHSHVTSDNHELCDEKSEEHSRDDAIVSNSEQVPQKKKKKSYDSHMTRMEVTTLRSYNKHPSPKSHDDHVTSMELADSSFNDSQEVVENPSSKSCDSKHITKDSLKSSYHWKNRQLLLQELKDCTENEEENIDDEEEEEEEEVANEDAYIDLHRYFVTKAQDIAKLEDKHDKWKRGRWSKQEIDILKRNVKAFMKENSIDDLAKWMFSNNSKHVGFYQSIARNIHRPLFPIYRKLVRIFDINNYVGKWDDEKDKELLRLQSCHGNMWTKIGRSLGISGQSCRDRYNLIKSRQRTRGGEWSKEEHDKLCDAIQEYCGDWQGTVGMLPSTVTWDMISEKVGSRSAIQCRQKWVFMLSWKQQGGEERWSSADDLRLIEELSKDEETEDEEEVDWEGLATGWDSVRSKYYLRRKWWVLKRSVPLSKLKTYQECIAYLLKHRVPALKKLLSQ